MTRCLLLITSVLCGCATSVPLVTPVGDTFEGTWEQEIAQAAQEWTDVGCIIDVGPGGRPVFIVPVDEWTHSPKLGWTNSHDVTLRAGLSPDNRHKFLLHEFGHVLGFGHRDWGIMTPTVTQTYVTEMDCNGE